MAIFILFIGFGICTFLGWRFLCRIVCPECHGDDRPGPCPTCGDQGVINRGSNPSPRGTGFKGTGRMERAVIPHCGRTHGRGWQRDRGENGLIG